MSSDKICFNLSSPSLQKIYQGEGENFLTVRLEYGLEANLNQNDSVVFLERDAFHPSGKSDYYFSSFGKINSIIKLKESSIEQKYNVYEINFTIDSKLKENNSLDNLIYSLKKIYNYKNPLLHFRRPYTYLEDIDYLTITEGRIFISRTAIGKIVNSLPRAHVQNFIIKLIEVEGLNFFVEKDYISALKNLKIYIEEEIDNNGKLLLSCEYMLKNNFGNQLNIEDIGFKGVNSNKSDYLIVQVRFFRRLFDITKEFNFWENLENTLQLNIENENYFNNKFIKTDWPIIFGEI